MMKENERADRIVFLSVPQSLADRVAGSSGFRIDPSVPIPAEIPAGKDKLDLEALSWEMILSGMIKTIANDPEAEDADYYRGFVLAVKPDVQAEFTEAAILKARNGDFDLALEILDALGGLFPSSPSVLLNRALAFEQRSDARERSGDEEGAAEGDFEALRAYEKAMALLPPFPDAFFNAGFYFMKGRRFDRARECFERYVALAAEGAAGVDPSKKARAAAVAKEIAARDLDDAAFRGAYESIKGGDEEGGMLKARDFIERHPSVWNGWFLLGWALRRLGRWEDAAAAFRKTVELGGDGCDTRNELAICLMESGDLEGARKELEKALRAEGENVKVISNLGVLALRRGDRGEAAAFFRTVLEIEPADPLAARFLAELED